MSNSVDVQTPKGTVSDVNPFPVAGSARNCLGHQVLNVTSGAVVTLTVPQSAVGAVIQADGASISITLDGVTVPTSTVGLRIDDGEKFCTDSPLNAVKIIARSSNTTVQVIYFDRV